MSIEYFLLQKFPSYLVEISEVILKISLLNTYFKMPLLHYISLYLHLGVSY